MQQHLLGTLWALTLGVLAAGVVAASPPITGRPHNVVVFVAHGLRSELVTPQSAPNLARLSAQGVRFANAHSLFPTLTAVNAAALATGQAPSTHGIFGDRVRIDKLLSDEGSWIPDLDDDPTLLALDDRYAGVLGAATVVSTALKAGFNAALIGQYGPVALQVPSRLRAQTLLIDDRTGHDGGIPVSLALRGRMERSGLSALAPGRADNADAGDVRERGTRSINRGQQTWFSAVTTRAVLPELKSRHAPFLLMYWSRDPGGSQQNQGDSPHSLEPGITGPTALAALRDADRALGELLESLDSLELLASTDIIITADHGFSTVSHQSQTSPSAQRRYKGVMKGDLPPGFLALDLAQSLGLAVHEPDEGYPLVDPYKGQHPDEGSAWLGEDAKAPEVVVAANGGADLIYLPSAKATVWVPKIVESLLAQDYVSGIFLADRFGAVPGTLPLSAVGLGPSRRLPSPDIVVSFRSFTTGCDTVLLCSALVADTSLQTGQGAFGSLSRADTAVYKAAVGPDFKQAYVDFAPSSTADIARTVLALLHLKAFASNAQSRVLSESLQGGSEVSWTRQTVKGPVSAQGLATQLVEQRVGPVRYVTAGGFPGRTVGLPEAEP